MDHQALFDRILRAVDDAAYLAYADSIAEPERAAMEEIRRALENSGVPVEEVRSLARRLHDEGRIGRVLLLSALHVIAASPRVRDYEEAARCIAEQELAALRLGGANLETHLASVDRHRGVLAFLVGQTEVALDYFSRAFERQRTAGNLANVLAALVRLGEEEEARELLERIRVTLPPDLVQSLDDMIAADADLAQLREFSTAS